MVQTIPRDRESPRNSGEVFILNTACACHEIITHVAFFNLTFDTRRPYSVFANQAIP